MKLQALFILAFMSASTANAETVQRPSGHAWETTITQTETTGKPKPKLPKKPVNSQ